MIDVAAKLREYREAQSIRSPYEQDWRLAAAHTWPRQYFGWQTVGSPLPSAHEHASATRRIAIDATGRKALPKYATIIERLTTPKTSVWRQLSADNKDLMRTGRVSHYFDELTRLLHKQAHIAKAKFGATQFQNYMSMGAYGWYAKTITQRRRRHPSEPQGLFFRNRANRNIYIVVDDQNEVIRVFMRLDLTAEQAKLQFGEDNLDKIVKDALKAAKNSMQTFEFVHVTEINPDYDPERIDHARFLWRAYTMFVKGQNVVGGDPKGVGGFLSNQWIIPRLFGEPEEVYAWSPAMLALPAMGSASAIKKTILKVGQKQAEPAILSHDDGVLSGGRMDLRPGKLNPGTLSRDGSPLVKPFDIGADFRPAESTLADDRNDINDTFLVNLFSILVETPEMTATQVLDRIAEKAALLSPFMTRVQEEDLDLDTDRSLVLLAEMDMLPDMPPELEEAEGEYTMVYSSPMAKQQRGEDVAGLARSLDLAFAYAERTQDPTILHRFDMETALPEIADIQGVPARWVHDDDNFERIKEEMRERAQAQEAIEAAPAMTGAMKALQATGGASG